jgi:hypothetical protein
MHEAPASGPPGDAGTTGRRRARRPRPAAASVWPPEHEDEPRRRWRIASLVPVLPGWRVVEASEDPVLLQQGRPEGLVIDVTPLIAWALLESPDGEQQVRGVTVDRKVPEATVVGLDDDQSEAVGVPDDLFLAYLAPGEELTDELRDRAREHVRAAEGRAGARLRRRRARGEFAAAEAPEAPRGVPPESQPPA